MAGLLPGHSIFDHTLKAMPGTGPGVAYVYGA
jgi:hypothetical protein